MTKFVVQITIGDKEHFFVRWILPKENNTENNNTKKGVETTCDVVFSTKFTREETALKVKRRLIKRGAPKNSVKILEIVTKPSIKIELDKNATISLVEDKKRYFFAMEYRGEEVSIGICHQEAETLSLILSIIGNKLREQQNKK